MKPDELSEAMKNVKDDYLQEADEIRKQGGPSREGFSPLFRGLMTAAAVLILAGGLTAAVLHIRNDQSGESGKTQVTSVSESRDETDTVSDTEKTADPENTTSPEKTTAPERTTAPEGSGSGDQTDEQ
ncbi:MAG: hypothetical protein IJL98_06650, partial [Lachnospiraceae bacterium]|nr:hypothetical protein [Lachnospiraceae bacterium]